LFERREKKDFPGALLGRLLLEATVALGIVRSRRSHRVIARDGGRMIAFAPEGGEGGEAISPKKSRC